MGKPKYEVWKSKRADGGENYHLWPAGQLAPEIQEHLTKVFMSPEMEEDLGRLVEQMEAEKQKPGK
jgi:hypothetical protein